MSPKERVRANIYKELLRQEKAKNKKISMYSVCFLFIGIIATSTYNHINNYRVIKNIYAMDNFKNTINQNNQKDTNENKLSTDMFYEFATQNNKLSLSPDEFFGFNDKI